MRRVKVVRNNGIVVDVAELAERHAANLPTQSE
jgi:hypothetical protein